MKHSAQPTIESLQRELAAARAEARRAHDEARTDDMTGLGNRRRWREATEGLQQRGERFAVLVFDLANLKAANAVLGHEHADDLLRDAAASIRAESDIAVRLGGDEFAVVLPGATAAQAREVRDRIEARAGLREVAPGAAVFLAGAETTWEPGADLRERLVAADAAAEARKRERKLQLGHETTREATLAAIAS